MLWPPFGGFGGAETRFEADKLRGMSGSRIEGFVSQRRLGDGNNAMDGWFKPRYWVVKDLMILKS